MKTRISSSFIIICCKRLQIVHSISYLSSTTYFCQSFEYSSYEKNIDRIGFVTSGSIDCSIFIYSGQRLKSKQLFHCMLLCRVYPVHSSMKITGKNGGRVKLLLIITNKHIRSDGKISNVFDIDIYSGKGHY